MRKIGIVYDTLQKSSGHHGTHKAFAGIPGVEIVMADPNPAKPEAVNSGAVRTYDDYRVMLEKERPDITAVCSRLPGDHAPVIKAALAAGSHVFCEKPLSADLEETDELIRLAENSGLMVGVAHLARFSKVFRTVKHCIDSGMIGKPLMFYGRGKEDSRGGGEDLMVLGTHILDIGAMLFGMPETVSSMIYQEGHCLRKEDRMATKEPVGLAAGDDIYARFRFPNAVNGSFESRNNLYVKQVRMGITITGTEGTLCMRYDQDRTVRLTRSLYPPEDDMQEMTVVPFEPMPEIPGALPIDYDHYGPSPQWYFADANREAARNFLAALDGTEKLASDIYDARNVLEMINGMYRSALEQRVISFPLADRRHPLL